MSTPVIVDARGHHCPVPTLRLRKAMEGARRGAQFELWATDPMARIDAPHLVSQLGGQVLAIETEGELLRIRVAAGEPPEG